ncbi:MAG: hypothetical protein JO246_00955 [Frankiaceae bacterium]|nr:hypothetical protein [Frankiaceae bacterium]MBV9869680.1 hypothetical protein [Frankiaceae bacterium]
MLFVALITVGILVLGLVLGGVARGWMMLPNDRRRLSVLAEELYAQARIDAITRTTIQTARDLVKNDKR